MFDNERLVGKATNSFKNISDNAAINNHVFSSSDIEEDDGEGPSTSSYNGANINDLSYFTEDLDISEQKDARQLFSEFRYLLENDGVFNRIRSEILNDMERMAQEQQNSDNSKLTHRQRFEFLERLDDLIDSANDLNEAHLAILRHIAVQLSKHSPLEALNDFELEHLFVLPEKTKENGIKDDIASPPKKVRRFRNSDERKLSTAGVQRVQQNDETNSIKSGFASKSNNSDIETTKTNSKENKEGVTTRESSKPNGFSSPNINGDKNSIKNESISEAPAKLPDAEKLSNGGKNSSIEMVEVKSEDQPSSNKNSSSKHDSDNSSNADVKEMRSGEKPKKTELKKAFKKPANGKANGLSKVNKAEKMTYRRASERHGRKSSKTPEPETKKPKRRVVASSESANETTVRQIQRRATRNNQPNNEMSNIDEQTYCLCDQISYGQMICCDNERCKIEWYHFECVGLKIKPGKGQKWFCPSCREGVKSTVLKSNLRR
ncbi:PHD-type domain-containing protein [Aphelenchoides bicaudatus]|nr:PHD-type domain-containing protein [Aphelenchoides bicaudatus]